MVRLLSKLLNIRPTEWPRLLILYGMLFIFVSGWVWASTILEAAFLAQPELGVAALPWFFIIKSVVAIPAIAVYAAFADRVSNTKLLIGILLVSALVIGIGLFLLSWGLPALAYPLLFLIVFVPLDDIYYTHWYTYINDFYDTQSAKRIVPALVTAISVAGIGAGLSMSTLNDLLGPDSAPKISFIWLGALLGVALLAWLMPYLLKEQKFAGELPKQSTSPPPSATAEHPHRSYLGNIREGYRYVVESPFLRWLASSALLLMLLLTLVQYQTSEILLATFKTTENLSAFTGRLSGLAYLVLLPIQLFVLSRIIGRIGLGNANLIYPAGNFAICAGLIAAPGWPTAALGYFSRTNFYGIIGYTIESLLYNAVPLRVKGRARAFIVGLIVPIGSLIGGLVLLTPLVTTGWFLPAAIGLLATAFLVNGLIIRQQYSLALIKILEEEDFSFLLSQGLTKLTITDPATLNRLRQKLAESSSHEFTIFMAKLISQIGGSAAIPILGQAAHAAGDARSRAAILDVLVAAQTGGEAVRQLYTDFLSDPAGQVRQSAIAGLEQLAADDDKQFLVIAQNLLTDPEAEVRAKVLPALLRANDAGYQTIATQTLNEFLHHPDASQRTMGVRMLSQTDDLRFIPTLLKFLDDPADEVRLEATIAVETLLPEKSGDSVVSAALEKMERLTHDPVERIRQAALTVLGRSDQHQAHQTIMLALTDPSTQVRTTAVDTLVKIGKAVIPTVHPGLNSPNPQLRKMTTVILSRINRREFGPLVDSHITGNLLEIYRTYGCLATLRPFQEYMGIIVLQNALQEQNQQALDEIFYLLMAVHEPEAVKIIADSLQSETPRIRANAFEALESLTTPQTARLIAPLFEPEPALDHLVHLSKETWDMSHPTTVAAIKQLFGKPNDPLIRAMTTYALGEMGVTLQPTPVANAGSSERPIQEKEAPKSGRRRPLDLLGALEKSELSESPGQPEAKTRGPKLGNLFDTLSGSDNHQPTSAPARRQAPGDLLGKLFDTPELPPPNSGVPIPFSLIEIDAMLEAAFSDPYIDVRMAARAAKRIIAGVYFKSLAQEEGILLSTVEKIIFLKEVPFFQSMTVDQLKVLANVCEEELFEEDARIFNEGDAGGALFVVVSGKVAIEQEKRKGSFARLATIEAHSYFGEMNLFDNSQRSATAIALQDTLTLRLRREPLIALARQHPDLSLKLINVLSQRLREANDRVAELTRTRPRELHKLFDKFD
ncbi:MAG: HEAT repeat domain-containing protein [Anaerolineae bacterium]